MSSLHECQKGSLHFTEGAFSDSECKLPTKAGEFRTARLEGQAGLTGTQTGSVVLKGTPLGIETEIACQALTSSEATAENVVSGFRGEGKAIFSECAFSKPAGCTVKEPIETVRLKAESEGLAGEVMRTKYTPVSGTAFVTLPFENCGLMNGTPSPAW